MTECSQLLGKWKLERNGPKMDDFMSYYGYGFLKRKAAAVANVELTVSQLSGTQLRRVVDSTFMKLDEVYTLGGASNPPNSEGLVKSHTLDSSGNLVSEVHRESKPFICWVEVMSVTGDELTLTRKWNGEAAVQYFTRL